MCLLSEGERSISGWLSYDCPLCACVREKKIGALLTLLVCRAHLRTDVHLLVFKIFLGHFAFIAVERQAGNMDFLCGTRCNHLAARVLRCLKDIQALVGPLKNSQGSQASPEALEHLLIRLSKLIFKAS